MKKSSEISSLKRKCSEFYEKNKDTVIDIILIGSYVKGKLDAKDVDIVLVATGDLEKLADRIENLLGEGFHVISYSIFDLFLKPESIWLSIIHEGMSMVTGRKISENLFLKSYVLFAYNTSKLEYKDKIRFFYALKGRGKNQGLVKSTGSIFQAKTVILTPIEHDNEVQEFFKEWKVPFARRRIFLED